MTEFFGGGSGAQPSGNFQEYLKQNPAPVARKGKMVGGANPWETGAGVQTYFNRSSELQAMEESSQKMAQLQRDYDFKNNEVNFWGGNVGANGMRAVKSVAKEVAGGNYQSQMQAVRASQQVYPNSRYSQEPPQGYRYNDPRSNQQYNVSASMNSVPIHGSNFNFRSSMNIY